MASGWAGDNAVNDQISDGIADEVARVRRRLAQCRESAFECEECGDPIPEARRLAIPGVRLCVSCQSDADRNEHAAALYNRKGSKDSQLR